MRTMVNLLPQSFRRQQMLRRRVIQWTTIISTVLAVGWIWHWYDMREDRQLTQQLETLSREHAPTQTMLKQLMDMRQQLFDLQQQETVVKELDCQRNALTLLGVISDAARKTKGRLRVTKFDLSGFETRPGATGVKPAGLLLDGISLDNMAIVDLVDGLKKSGIFSRVDLLALKEREDKDAAMRDYQVRCEF